jgi:SAM-dependent methyltransferase
MASGRTAGVLLVEPRTDHMKNQDATNQGCWAAQGPLRHLASLQGFTDEGERAAYWRIADEVRNQPILDLGVGPGRTIPLLRALTKSYVAIDYLPAMVEVARQNYPFVDVDVGDARDLSRFADASFALVVFSFSGIDAVDHEDRRLVLREAHRVLKPNGIFWFSTLNLNGGYPSQRPWAPVWPARQGGWIPYAAEVVQTVRAIPRGLLNYGRLRSFSQRGDDWLVAPFSAHAYGLLVHYASLSHQLAELKVAGFKRDPEVFDPDGDPVRNESDAKFFNILARK